MTYRFEQHRITGGIGADTEYWRGLEDGKFLLPRCAGCALVLWPAHFRCGRCGSWEFAWVEFAARGSIYSWTRSHYAFDRVLERAADVPYVTALVEIDGANGARVLGVLAGEETGLHVGRRAHGVILPPSEKTKNYPSISWRLDPSEPTR